MDRRPPSTEQTDGNQEPVQEDLAESPELGASSAPPASDAENPEGKASGGGESYYESPVWKRFYAFMLGPALVAAAVLALIVGYGVLFKEDVDPQQYVQQLQSGGDHSRAQAAFGLTRYLQPSITAEGDNVSLESDASYQEKLRQVRLYTPELISIFEDPKRGDESTRRFLALAFSYLGDKRVVAPLSRSLQDPDTELVHYALVALARVSETEESAGADSSLGQETVEAVLKASQREEADVRATATYVLGVLGTSTGRDRLEAALEDGAPAVRWNAAFGLARGGSDAGQEIIAEILDRGPLYQGVGDPQRQRDLYHNAIRSAGLVRSPMLNERLSRIAESDEDLKARDLAIKLLESKQPS